jgi:acetyl esterase/lipase
MGSYKWIVRVARLSAFVLLLSPALINMAYRYFKSPNIIRDVRYGPHARNFLDIYVPPYQHGRRKGARYPVAIFFTGGAWYEFDLVCFDLTFILICLFIYLI